MTLGSKPLAISFGFPKSKKVFTFLGKDGEIEIHGQNREISKLLKNCNGYRSLRSICKKAGLKPKATLEMAKLLNEVGVLVDSAEY